MEKGEYAQSDLVEIKTALHLPYLTGGSDFEPLKGSIELSGIHYDYVKRKVANDTLYILCLPNKSKTQLSRSSLEYQHQVTDIPSAGTKKDMPVKKTDFNIEYSHSPGGYECNRFWKMFDINRRTANTPLTDGFIPRYLRPPGTAQI